MQEIRRAFEAEGDGLRAVAARVALVDGMVRELWAAERAREGRLGRGVMLAAVGGYGRGQLFPYSDIDLLVCAAKPAAAKDAVRRISQALWDVGLQVALTTRSPKECERLDPANAEFGLALLDMRFLAGDGDLAEALEKKLATQRKGRDGKRILAELEKLVRERHGKYGETLFHLEPNIKDCPGGLRDMHVCEWLTQLCGEPMQEASEFQEAEAFLAAVRCFLHWRHERDDNVLDWQAQDAAAERAIGVGTNGREGRRAVDAAYWMRVYFRHARAVERTLERTMESAGLRMEAARPVKGVLSPADASFRVKEGRIELEAGVSAEKDPARDPEVVLRLFGAVSRTGMRLGAGTEERIGNAIPVLSNRLMEGAELWKALATILNGESAGAALRAMHALGVLDLILPEFHGIDALVIRDAYHRYTVDEHTFVLIDTLHELESPAQAGAAEWRARLGGMIGELQSPALLYLAALMHDTGKGRAGDDHAAESSRLTEGVLARLAMDPYDTAMVLQLIETHLEMSAALRRDIFDTETVRTFAGKVQTHESLKMLTLFTYADIRAVHPDALTPWKAENLWRLSMSTSNQLDRNVDQERVQTRGQGSSKGRLLARLLGVTPEKDRRELEHFVEGFPERYLRTRPAEAIYGHFRMARELNGVSLHVALNWQPETTEIVLVSRDRPGLFASIAAALAAWGMNVVTADAFANAEGVVVDSFRFQDTFRTLELNESEREHFVESVRDVVEGRVSAETLLSGRRRGRRASPRVVVETSIEFDDEASATSTLLQVVAQDVTGLLRAISVTLSRLGYNVEVALVDTEGETAIDVFYLTQNGNRLTAAQKRELRAALRGAIEENAQ